MAIQRMSRLGGLEAWRLGDLEVWRLGRVAPGARPCSRPPGLQASGVLPQPQQSDCCEPERGPRKQSMFPVEQHLPSVRRCPKHLALHRVVWAEMAVQRFVGQRLTRKSPERSSGCRRVQGGPPGAGWAGPAGRRGDAFRNRGAARRRRKHTARAPSPSAPATPSAIAHQTTTDPGPGSMSPETARWQTPSTHPEKKSA